MNLKEVVILVTFFILFGFGLLLLIPPVESERAQIPNWTAQNSIGVLILIASRLFGAKHIAKSIWFNLIESLIIVAFACLCFQRAIIK